MKSPIAPPTKTVQAKTKPVTQPNTGLMSIFRVAKAKKGK